MEPKPSQASEAQTSQPAAKPAKEKKPRTEAQQAATAKALAAMTAKRKEQLEAKAEKKEVIKKAKKVVEDKILKDDVGFVLRKDYESTISNLSSQLGELRALYATAQQKATSTPAPAPAAPRERIVERVIEKEAPSRSTTPQRLTGHALLDKLFFEK